MIRMCTWEHAKPLRRSNDKATFRGFAVARKEMLGHDELQDGVAEKFEALVIEMFFLSFGRNARMSQRLDEQTDITELITDALFQRMHVSLGRAVRRFFENADRRHNVDRPLQDRVVEGRGVSAAGAPLLRVLRRLDLGIRSRQQSGFVQMRTVGFKNKRSHAFGQALLKDLSFFRQRLRHREVWFQAVGEERLLIGQDCLRDGDAQDVAAGERPIGIVDGASGGGLADQDGLAIQAQRGGQRFCGTGRVCVDQNEEEAMVN